MESSEVNRSTAAKSKVEQHVEKSAPPPPPAPPPNNAAGDYYDDDDECSVSSSSSAASSPSNRSSTRKPPESQEMEGYRIPASVFERNKSSTPGDWSVASNESLFSIHVGNMSFTNDQYTWHSEELTPSPASAPAAVPSTSDHMFSYSSGGGGAADMRSHELGIAEATMLEVIKENEARPRPPFMPPEARQARRSAGSNQSNMSFAFSVNFFRRDMH